jgi:hypothetical protein
MALYKTNWSYYVKIDAGGRQITKSARTLNRDEALKYEAQLRAELGLPVKRAWRKAEGIESLKSKLRVLARQPGFDQALLEIMEEQEQEMES